MIKPVEAAERSGVSDYSVAELPQVSYFDAGRNRATKTHPLLDRLQGPLGIAGRGLLALGSFFGAQQIVTPTVFAGGFPMSPDMSKAYDKYGGFSALGSPISGEWTDAQGRRSQAMEKIIPQLSPDGKVEFLNVYDELSRIGEDPWLKAYRQTPPSQNWGSDAGKTWGQVVENHLNIVPPATRAFIVGNSYWMEKFGLPMGVEDSGPWITTRGQRAAFQEMKEDTPWAKKGQILIANGGSVAKEAGGIIPESVLAGISVPAPTPEAPKPTDYSTFPPDIAAYMNKLVLPSTVRLIRSGDTPPGQPGCTGACYLEGDKVVWLVSPSRHPDPAPDQVSVVYELGHAHKQKIRELEGRLTCGRSDSQRCWEDTSEYQAFIDTFNKVNVRLRQQGQQQMTLNDTGNYIALFNNLWAGYVLGDPSFKNAPANWSHWVPNTYQYPEWVGFFNTWAKKAS